MKLFSKTTLAIAFTFATIGVMAAFLGPFVVKISAVIDMSYSQKGVLLSTLFGGGLAGIITAIFIGEKIGKIPLLQFGATVSLGGLIAGTFALNYFPLLAALLTVGFGFGVYQAVANALVLDFVSHFSKAQRTALTPVFHFFFGLGAIASPFLVELIQQLSGNVHLIMPAISLFPLINIVLLQISERFESAHQHLSDIHFKKRSNIAVFAYLLICIAIYAGLESSMFSWIALFWSEAIHAWVPFQPSYAASTFWVTFALGRLLLGRLVALINLERYVTLSGVLASVVALFWALFGHQAPVSFAIILIIGLALSCLFPSIILMADNILPGKTALLSAFFTLAASLSGAFYPMLVGHIAELRGIRIFPAVFFINALLYTAIIAIAAIIHHRMTREHD